MNPLELPAQLWRLAQFRASNPGVTIGRDTGFGFWQAWIPVSNGGTVITRYGLQDLLDKLEELTGSEGSPADSDPGSPARGAGQQDHGR